MGIFSNFVQYLPLYLLSLPVVLMALSIHEAAHGYAAYKLGDPTARNLGRITLNPVKHLDVLGFLAMLLFHVGWAKPVPINTRYFKNPRRDMAITGAAGPLSNLCLAIIHLLILRVSMIFVADRFAGDVIAYATSYVTGSSYTGSLAFTLVSLVLYLLYLGVMLNVILTVFNLIPIPPFDGSRIFYAFLPPKLYFGVMKYERIIMLVVLLLFVFGILTGPLTLLENAIINGLFTITGMGKGSEEQAILSWMITYVRDIVSL
jgi:Zn-dependent protease